LNNPPGTDVAPPERRRVELIVTKVGARRGDDKSWSHALSRQELIEAVQDNLRNLGVDKPTW
jgi:aryl-alcohol dehydrogenase-like predicted oxidoreductase